ncbi:MAG: tRNA (adenosine(37)-N6)-threonylcarbamoyltransferase complex dimerization subunit type 1 TsaB [Brumimicrobium sp.]
MTKLLHIETATKVCSVALSQNGECVSLVEENSENYTHSENLTLFIECAIKEAGWTLSELDAIVVTSGPGSYTGLRIGVSTAKGLCYALNLPLISVGSIESIVAIASEKYIDKSICALIDAKRMEVFSAVYDHNGKCVKPLSADIIDENTYNEFMPFVVCGDGAKKLQEIWREKNASFDLTVISSAKGQIKIAYEKFSKHLFEDLAYFEPKYLKDFIGTKSKKKSF